MHSLDENGNECVNLDEFNGLSDSIRLRKTIDGLLEQFSFPSAFDKFSITIFFRSGQRYYLSNLYHWAIPYRTEGYYRGDQDHVFDIYNNREFFIQENVPKDTTQLAILNVMQERYKLYTVFAMVRQCYECDIIIETYTHAKVADPETLYYCHRHDLEQFSIKFIDEMINHIQASLPEYGYFEFLQDKEFRAKVITRELNSLNSILTTRELECLFLATQGQTSKEIAKNLFLSSETVNSHLKSVRRKLNCNTISQAVVIAIKRDLFKYINSPNLGIL